MHLLSENTKHSWCALHRNAWNLVNISVLESLMVLVSTQFQASKFVLEGLREVTTSFSAKENQLCLSYPLLFTWKLHFIIVLLSGRKSRPRASFILRRNPSYNSIFYLCVYFTGLLSIMSCHFKTGSVDWSNFSYKTWHQGWNYEVQDDQNGCH